MVVEENGHGKVFHTISLFTSMTEQNYEDDQFRLSVSRARLLLQYESRALPLSWHYQLFDFISYLSYCDM
jgi:hypothetical protein